ncbi:radical SAM family heme chaperone HemW [Puniceicoccaceae bacterium]|nr:radical SAM family heme chaperone HemW [Puniceicoccaceae bacterium]
MPLPVSLNPIGIYCHVPFCASTCDFCAFYQEKPRRGDLERYFDAMEFEFSRLPSDREVDTVFWGGGTPGLLAAKDLERLGRALLDRLPQPPIEWTVEMAPSTVKADKMKVLRELGVTRISMGVQSFQPELLDSLGRLHNPKQIYTAWERVQEAGFQKTNLDLMFAIPNQTIEQWESDIREASRLGPSHLSTYCLTFEEDTALYVKLSQGKVSIDEDKELRFYERGWELLAELGYEQYEISNFAKADSECRHNVNTWKMHEWIGCGPSAASQYAGERYQRPANLDEWCVSLDSGESPKFEQVRLGNEILFTDAVIFGLRMNRGVDLDEISERFPCNSVRDNVESMLRHFAGEGLLLLEGSKCRLTHSGRLLCDRIGSELLEC